LIDIERLKEIKEMVEKSGLFSEYRIQTSGQLFRDRDKEWLFNDWIKEITVVSAYSEEDMKFYGYKEAYLTDGPTSANALNLASWGKIRVNLVCLKDNISNICEYIESLAVYDNVKSIALKILDNSNNGTPQSKWISENALTYADIPEIIKELYSSGKCYLYKMKDKRFEFLYEYEIPHHVTGRTAIVKNKKPVTLNYDASNHYEYINIMQKMKKPVFDWHKAKIPKGIYRRVFENRRGDGGSQGCYRSRRQFDDVD